LSFTNIKLQYASLDVLMTKWLRTPWDMTLHHWAISLQFSEDIFLQNVRNKLLSDAEPYPGKMKSLNYNALEYGEEFIFTNLKPQSLINIHQHLQQISLNLFISTVKTEVNKIFIK